jgi:hypothetical protein
VSTILSDKNHKQKDKWVTYSGADKQIGASINVFPGDSVDKCKKLSYFSTALVGKGCGQTPMLPSSLLMKLGFNFNNKDEVKQYGDS